MHKFFVSIIFILFFPVLVLAKNNALIGIKLLPLPDNKLKIDLKFAEKLKKSPNSFITQVPPSLVLDFINTDNQLAEALNAKSLKVGAIKGYRIVSVPNRVRVILDLDNFVSYSERITGNVYALVLNGKNNQLFEPRKEIFIANKDNSARYVLKKIDFRGVGKEGGKVVIDLSAGGVPAELVQQGAYLRVIFHNTHLPVNLSKRYDVSDFQSPAKMMTLRQEGQATHLSIKNQGDYGHFAYQINKQFMIDIFPLSEDEIKQAKLKKQIYTGKAISLDFQNIEIKRVLQLLANLKGMNLVISDKVGGNISLRLDNIPWDQAFDLILKTNGLDKRVTGNVIMVAPAIDLVQGETAELAAQKTIASLAPVRSELIQVKYAKATDLVALLNKTLSATGGSAQRQLNLQGATQPGGEQGPTLLNADSRTNAIWVRGTGDKIEEIRSLVEQLDIPVKQVLIEARIVDVTKDFERDLGIRFGISRPIHLSGTLEGANQMAQGIAPADVTPIAERLNMDFAAQPVAGQAASIALALAKLGDGVLLDLELSAMESEGKGEIIASPRLITTNGQAAAISSGQEIPYQEATSSGATSVAFKDAVLSLKVTPQITPDSKVVMDLQVNQDTPSAQTYNGVPAILTKEIQTSVLVENGQTIVLGGIYQQTKTSAINRVPFLGELPLLGGLFRNSHNVIQNEELLIFITPRIITNTLEVTAIEEKRPVVIKKFKLAKKAAKLQSRPWKE